MRAIVVGAGIAGLAAAFRRLQAGAEVTVLEYATGCTTDAAKVHAAEHIDSRLADFLECDRRPSRNGRSIGGRSSDTAGHATLSDRPAQLDARAPRVGIYQRVEHTATGVEPSYLESLQ